MRFVKHKIFERVRLRSTEEQVCPRGTIQKTGDFSPLVRAFVGYALWMR